MSSSTCSGGVDDGSEGSELGGPGVFGCGDPIEPPDTDEARRVEFVEFDDVVESWYSTTTSHVCNVASGANDTLRFARDFLRASRREITSFSISFLSFSSRSLAAACCSSSVRNVTRVSPPGALPSTWNGLGRLSVPLIVALGPTSKSIKFSVFCADGGVAFLGLPLRVEMCAGISRSGGIVGFRIDLGGG